MGKEAVRGGRREGRRQKRDERKKEEVRKKRIVRYEEAEGVEKQEVWRET